MVSAALVAGPHVLVALDSSKSSRAALDFAVRQLLLPHGDQSGLPTGRLSIVTVVHGEADASTVDGAMLLSGDSAALVGLSSAVVGAGGAEAEASSHPT